LKIKEITGSGNVLTGDAVRDFEFIWKTHDSCDAKAIVYPTTTDEVAAVLRLCHEHDQTVVPFGGLTGLVQGCTTTPDDIALSLEKMNNIEELDTTAQTMTVQAGVTMQQAQEAADAEGLFFPVDIGARDNCMLGGNVATNAGGTKVIRYGMMRDSVLGLEAVLADGTVISSMNRYIKNNSGFDLKHLFIGTEGVLGIITRIVFRLAVKPNSHNVALLACQNFDDVIAILNKSRESLGSTLCGFEVMWGSFYKKAVTPEGRQESPLSIEYPLYVIVESMGTSPASDDQTFESAMTAVFDSELALDGVIAKSDKEREAIWAIRGEVEWLVTAAYNFDVSLRSADVGAYIDAVTNKMVRDVPDVLVAAFGHLGDNNIHIAVIAEGCKTTHARIIEKHVYESLKPFEGAISAEHGIGLEKKPYLPISRTDAEISLMKSLKTMLDPKNILNPGKVISLD
jgi:FAD/FMN-containing dehydrogenase